MTRQSQGGFTLIESLVALVVLAITSVALLSATEAHISRIGGLETRAAAVWVTENYLAELNLGLAPSRTPPKISTPRARTATEVTGILAKTRRSTSGSGTVCAIPGNPSRVRLEQPQSHDRFSDIP